MQQVEQRQSVDGQFAHSDDALLLHPAWGVMKFNKLHCHLVVDWQQELLPCFELGFQLSALFIRQIWGG